MRSDPTVSALRLRLAQEAAQFGYWDYEVATSAVLWDDACATLFGIALEDFEGTLDGFAARCHPDDLPGVQQTLAGTGAGESMEITFRGILPDDTVRHLLSRGQAIAGPDGQVERMVGVLLDVTRLHAGAERLGGLARVALAMAGAEDDESLTRIVIEHGAAVLGADGGAVCVRDDGRGIIRLAMTDSLGPEVQMEFGELPLDGPLPGSYTARTGVAVFLPDRAAGLAFSPVMQIVYDGTGRDAWAVLPLRSSDRLLGSLVVSWAAPREFFPAEQELLAAFAAQTAQALDRIQVQQAERRQAEEARRLSETLQRSLLTSPPQPDGVQVAVRYSPAAQQAAVGGDWYDAFLIPDGSLTLVIGDCVGHDRQAAAAMATMRNLLRATAYVVGEPPAAVLAAMERTMAGLQVEVLATALLASIRAEEGQHRLLWSNAGHLPPLLRLADGSVRLLESDPDLLLGLTVDAGRRDSSIDLEAGATVLLYTDGLVERRGEDLDVGIERLRARVEAFGHLPLEELCDVVLTGLLGDLRVGAEDDVALLAVRLQDEGARPVIGESRSLALPPEPASARAARVFISDLLERAGLERWREAAVLAVSEVVTNALLHAHTPVTVTARLEQDRLRVEVRDHNPSLPSPRSYDEQATTGRGMSLVATITKGHGVEPLGADGKVVWFTVGDDTGSEEDLLALWGALDDGPDSSGAVDDSAAVLLRLPATLWLAARQHHDAMIRELTLHRASQGLPTDDLALADAARRTISDAVDLALSTGDRDRSPDASLPSGHPSSLPMAPRAVDAVIAAVLPSTAYAALQDVLDEAEALARRDDLLVHPALPEVVAVRDWACEQIIAQLGGTPPTPWPGTDDQRFTEFLDDGRSIDWDPAAVSTSARGAVAVDDANRIVAVSPPLLMVLGYALEDLLGRRVVVLVPPRYREAHVAGFTRHLTTGVAHALGVELELPVLRADGTELSCRFLIGVEGTPSGRSVYTAWITPLV